MKYTYSLYIFAGLLLLAACKKDPEPMAPANRAPMFDMPMRTYACADSTFELPIRVSDADNDALEVTLTGAPAWLTADVSGLKWTGKPSKFDVDSTVLEISATDGQLTTKQQVALVVRSKSSFAQTLAQRLTAAFTSITPGIRGVSVAVYTPDLGIVTAANGISAPWNNSPALSPEYRFRVASVSKSVIAALVLQLAERGQLALDDQLETHLPNSGLPNASTITIRQLLSHTAGVFDHFNANAFWNDPANTPYKVWTSPEIFQFAINNGALFAPGTKYAYSNTGFYALGALLEKKYNLPLSKIFEQELATPMGLTQSFFDDFSGPSNKVPTMAENQKSYGYHLSAVGAAGSLVATPTDLARLGKAIYGGRVFASSWVTEMTKDYGSVVGGESYGLGTRRWTVLGVPHVGHTGNIMDYRSILMYIPENDVSIAICANGPHSNWFTLVDDIFALVVDTY